MLIGNIASFVISFFFVMYVARYLGAQGFGVLSFALAFTMIFGVFTDIGLQGLMIRELSRDKALAPKFMGNIAVLKILLVIVTFGLIALTINLLGYPRQTITVVYLMAMSVMFNAFSMMFYGVFRAYERMEFEALGQGLGSLLTLAGAFWAMSHDSSVVAFGWVYFFVALVTLVYSVLILRWKFVMPKIQIDIAFWREALKQAWPFALAGVFLTIYLSIDSVMLSRIKGDEAVGWYNAAYRLISIIALPFGAFFSATFPIMSRLHVASKEFLRFTYEKSFKYMLILGVPIGVGTTLLANKLILLIFGYPYYPSIIVLQIIIWSMVFQIVSGPFVNLFQSLNRQIVVVWVLAAGAVFKVILNIVLISGHSYTGVSISTLVSGFIALLLSVVWSSRIGYSITTKNTLAMIIRVSVASAVMCVVILYLRNFYILALIPISALVYFVVLYLIRGLDKEDKLLLEQIIGKKRAADTAEK